jgi:hypothetical protein
MGSYARGDYYRGDLWGSIGGFLRRAAPVAASFIPGVGGLVGKVVGGLLGGGAIAAGGAVIEHFASGGPSAPTLPMRALAPPQGPLTEAAGRSMRHPFAGGARFRGEFAARPNKSTYVTRGGGTSHWPHGLVLHPKGTVAVRPRRMHVTNPRAALRALRRLHGFAKMARKVYRITHPHHKKGSSFGHFVKRGKRA